MPEYVIDGDGNPIGTLATYTFSKSAIPLDPRDTSGQIPAWQAVIADAAVNVRGLGGQQLTLHDWTGEDVAATVVQVQSSGRHVRHSSNPLTVNPLENRHSGLSTINANSLFDRLNATLTVFPMETAVYTANGNTYTGNTVLPQHVLTQWCMMAGVTPYRVSDTLLHYVDGTDAANYYGYAIGALTPWERVKPYDFAAQTASIQFCNCDSTVKPPSLPLNDTDGLLFGTYFAAGATGESVALDSTIGDSTYSNVTITLTRSGSTWTLTESLLKRGKTAYSAPTTLLSGTFTASTDVAVALLVQADPNNPANIIPTLRLLTGSASGTTDYTDIAGASVPSHLRSNPVPDLISLNAGTNELRPLYFSISSTSTLPTQFPLQQVQFQGVVAGSSPMTAALGFTDNLWNRLREFCSVYEIEYDLVGDAIVFKNRSSVTRDGFGNFIPAHVLHTTEPTSNDQQNQRARRVAVEWSKLTSTPGDNWGNRLLWKATSVWTVQKGETQVQTVQTDSSFTTVTNPTPVDGEPVPYNLNYGTYTVWGNDGYVVDPQWWTDNGGSIKVEPTGKSGEIKITIQAPTVDSTQAPYKISEGESNPALYIFGSGYSFTKETMYSYTGDATAAQDIGDTYSSDFIVDAVTARNAAFKLAQAYCGPTSQISFTVSRPDLKITMNSDGTPAAPETYEMLALGDNICWDGAYYRVLDLSVGPSGYNVTKAEMNNTIDVINGEFVASGDVDFWNSFYGDTPISEINMTPIPADYTPTPPLYPAENLFPAETTYPSGG